jgi:plastocyanin
MSARRRLAVAAALTALAAATGGPAASAMPGMPGMDHGGAATAPSGPRVSVGYAAFATPHLDVVAGDTVTWTNDSARAHDVVADDQSFDSGRLVVGDSFARRFDQDGTFTYLCSLHPFMTGEIDVHSVVLDRPADRAGSGKPFVLSGRVAAGISGSVTIEGDDGSGFRRATTAAVAPDGTFRTAVVPAATTSYRAVAGDRRSAAVQLLVLDHAVAVTATRRGSATALAVHVTPAAPGATVVLQLALRDRFGWWPAQRARLDRSSTARFVVARRSAAPARVLLTLPDGATELARSRTVHVGLMR